MNAFEMADELEKYFGNPLGPKRYAIVKDAIAMIRLQAEEIEALRNDITDMVVNRLEDKV